MYRVTSTPTAPKRSVPQPMLLTSDESLAVLEEKENAKKAVLLEKERRRAEKKQQREDLSIKKREEKARKAEEKARIQQEKARKQQEKPRPHQQGDAKKIRVLMMLKLLFLLSQLVHPQLMLLM